MNIVESRSSLTSPLVNYALQGLQKCWLPEHGRWSHIYHLDGRDQPNESVPRSDVFYTLNVLLGLSRLSHVSNGINVSATFERNVLQLQRLRREDCAFDGVQGSVPLAAAATVHNPASGDEYEVECELGNLSRFTVAPRALAKVNKAAEILRCAAGGGKTNLNSGMHDLPLDSRWHSGKEPSHRPRHSLTRSRFAR